MKNGSLVQVHSFKNRALSMLLSFLMVLSAVSIGFVFAPKAVASAAGGQYLVRVLLVATNDYDMEDGSMTITYYRNNKVGSDGTYSHAVGNSVDSQTNIFNGGSANFGYFPSNAGVWLDGFPTSVSVRMKKTSNGWFWNTDGKFDIYVQVYKSNGWSDYGGTATNNGSINDSYKKGLYTGNASISGTGYFSGTASTTSNYPTFDGTASVSGDDRVYVGTNGTAATGNYTFSNHTDQYGTAIYPIWSATNGTINTAGNTYSTYTKTNAVSYADSSDSKDYTGTVSAQHPKGTATKSTTVYVPHDITINYGGGKDASNGPGPSTAVGYTKNSTTTSDGKTNTVALPSLTKNGYLQDGWDISPSGCGSVSGSTYSIGNGNATLTAKWKPKVIDLTLDNQNATAAGTSHAYYKYNTNAYYTANDSGTLSGAITSITKPEKTGYTFGGYYTQTNGGGTQYINENGAFVNNPYSAIHSDTTLYAKWTINKYTVIWENADGTVLETDNNVEYGATPSYDGNEPTKATDADYHYTFSSWSGPATVTGATTMTAQFTSTAHTSGEWITSDTQHWKACTVCGYITSTKTNHSGGTATCTAAATCSTCNKSYGTVNANNHNYNYAGATFNWNDYACTTATVRCSNNTTHTETENTSVTSAVTTDPSYTDDGVRTYTAKFTKNSTDYTSQKTAAVPSLYSLIDLDDAPPVAQGFTAGGVYTFSATAKKSGIGYSLAGLSATAATAHPVAKSSGAITGYNVNTLTLSNASVTILSGNKIRITPTSMNFSSPIVFYAVVAVTGTQAEKYDTNTVYSYRKITVR
ncbi:MAG: hypothetical protein K6G90_10375, partial [Clostridia bacterium]|nr:hypothetical protein [Clostridia bacterium]